MTTLYSYCIPIDDGAAPNPYWGICTLVICKPAIRRTTRVGDWIVGTGSAHTRIGDVRNKVVYIMRVSQKMTLQEYDLYVQEHCPYKVPDWFNADVRRQLGDAIYDFSEDPPRIRPSVHTEENRERDLRGKYALISDHFYYFGDNPIPLPEYLLPIVRQQQGHRSSRNAPYVELFVSWLSSLKLTPNQLYGNPQIPLRHSPIISLDDIS